MKLISLFLLSSLLFVISFDAPAQDGHGFRGYEPGRYEGTALNTTANQRGKAVFEITNIDASSGRVNAHFIASDGLVGEAWLTGSIDAGSVMRLSGKLLDWKMTVEARPTGNGTIVAAYRLEGASNQQGEFRVTFRANASPVLAPGNPPLTRAMVDSFVSFYEFLLDLKFSAAERDRLQIVIVEAWNRGDRQVVDGVLKDLEFAGQKSRDEIKSALGPGFQTAIVSEMRRYSGNPLRAALVEDFDRAHPERREATRTKGFADLVGTWEWHDALTPERKSYNNQLTGISFVDSKTLEITRDGQFKRHHVHEHCTGGRTCCSLTSTDESGTVAVENGSLVFQVNSGTEMNRDNCNPRMNIQDQVKPHREIVRWNIRPNPAQNNAPTLCYSPESGGDSTCFVRQPQR